MREIMGITETGEGGGNSLRSGMRHRVRTNSSVLIVTKTKIGGE